MERKYMVETFRLCISKCLAPSPDSPEVSAGTWFKLFTLFNKSKCLCQIPYSIFCFIHILLYSSFPVILNHNNHVTQTKCYADVNVPPANTIVTPLKGSHKVLQLKTNSLPESDSTLSRVTAPFTRSQMQSFLLVYLLVFWSSEVPSEFPLNYEVPWSYKTFQVPPANQFQRPKDYMCRLNHNVLISLALSTPLVFLFFSQHIFIDYLEISYNVSWSHSIPIPPRSTLLPLCYPPEIYHVQFLLLQWSAS